MGDSQAEGEARGGGGGGSWTEHQVEGGRGGTGKVTWWFMSSLGAEWKEELWEMIQDTLLSEPCWRCTFSSQIPFSTPRPLLSSFSSLFLSGLNCRVLSSTSISSLVWETATLPANYGIIALHVYLMICAFVPISGGVIIWTLMVTGWDLSVLTLDLKPVYYPSLTFILPRVFLFFARPYPDAWSVNEFPSLFLCHLFKNHFLLCPRPKVPHLMNTYRAIGCNIYTQICTERPRIFGLRFYTLCFVCCWDHLFCLWTAWII